MLEVRRLFHGDRHSVQIKIVVDGRMTSCIFDEFNRDGSLHYVARWVLIFSRTGDSHRSSSRRHAGLQGETAAFDRLLARWIRLVAPELRSDPAEYRLVITALACELGPIEMMRLLTPRRG